MAMQSFVSLNFPDQVFVTRRLPQVLLSCPCFRRRGCYSLQHNAALMTGAASLRISEGAKVW